MRLNSTRPEREKRRRGHDGQTSGEGGRASAPPTWDCPTLVSSVSSARGRDAAAAGWSSASPGRPGAKAWPPDPQGRVRSTTVPRGIANGSTGSGATRLAPGSAGSRPRSRGSVRSLQAHAHGPRHRGAWPHPLQAGQDPGLVLHGPRQRGGRRRRRRGDGPRRRGLPDPARHGRPHHPRRRAVADLRPVHGPRRRPHARPRRQRPPRRRAAGPARDGQPPARHAPRRGRHGARLPHPRGDAASRSRGAATARPRAATRTRG